MKRVLLLLLVVATVVASTLKTATAQEMAPQQRDLKILNSGVVTQGTEVPFPFGTEIPFPWSSIEGTWEVRDREVDAYFSFQVQRNESGKKVLKVTHIDKMTRKVFGEGAGFANEDQKIVRAVMRAHDFNYLIFVRVFRDTKAQTRTATVLTIRYLTNVGSSEIREQHYILRKVSKQPLKAR
ncbi:MAG: hypothetical protein NDI61_01450 [Bdellovibrionaceae bacterium]|nr:hypothetical protein [Pseudobdellovibrionaceae bacterium]